MQPNLKIIYNGKTPLMEAIGKLYRLNRRDVWKITKLINEAKIGLGLNAAAKSYQPPEIKLSIYTWHVEKLNREQTKIAVIGDVYDFKQVRFALRIAGKRTTVMLEQFVIKTLQRSQGLPDALAVRVWLQDSINNDARFDPEIALTKQINRLIIESLEY